MIIKNFSFIDSLNNINIDNVKFSKINLLVGASGAGKTKILESIRTILYFLNSNYIYNPFLLNGRKWEVTFLIDNEEYTWECEFEKDLNVTQNSVIGIKSETLNLNGKNNKELILKRENDFVKYGNNEIRLNNKASAISMLTDDIFSKII